MEKKYRILGEFVKNISAETKDVESYIYTKENISKFKIFIDINTKPLKNKMAEISISTKFKETDENKKNSYFEYAKPEKKCRCCCKHIRRQMQFAQLQNNDLNE